MVKAKAEVKKSLAAEEVRKEAVALRQAALRAALTPPRPKQAAKAGAAAEAKSPARAGGMFGRLGGFAAAAFGGGGAQAAPGRVPKEVLT